MSLDLVVGGMPRGGTTVAAKFMSLHPDIFCYAGETHLIPFMHDMFGHLPCRPDKINLVARYLRQQFMTAMVEMPRFSVSQGAHPGNLIFDETSVDDLVDAVRGHLTAQLYGANLYQASLMTLGELLAKADPRHIRGEKTPSNIFAMADFADTNIAKNIVVMREPLGVLRSMKARVEGGDSYAAAFKGDLEANMGMYLEFAMAARRVLNSAQGGLLVRYEDIAQNPATVLQEMFNLFGREPEERVIEFVEGIWHRDVADRAPMNYRRLDVKAGFDALSPVDVWKIFSLTRELREVFGYSDEAMAEFGFEISTEWPGIEVPSKILPLYGFHPAGWIGGPWMKRRGGLVAYLGTGRSHNLTLELKSKFPEHDQGEVELRISVSGVLREVRKVSSGSCSTRVDLKIQADDLVPMGTQGGYAVIDLVSSLTYCEIGHDQGGNNDHEISFQMANWKIDRKSPRWWWRG
jgi:hypothetical protein